MRVRSVSHDQTHYKTLLNLECSAVSPGPQVKRRNAVVPKDDLLTFAVPLNLGKLEGIRIVVFQARGCSALLGMAYAVAVRVAQLFWAAFGLVSYSFLAAPGRKPSATSSRCYFGTRGRAEN